MSESVLLPPAADGLERIIAWIEKAPIARWLHMGAGLEEDQFLYTLTFNENHIGNPISRHFHGGVVSTFLQASAQAELKGRAHENQKFRLISVHCNYLRPARAVDMQASVSLVQAGRRLAFLDALCWQGSPEKIIARATVAARLLRS